MYLYTGAIVQGPVDTTVCEGDNATFSCVSFTPLNGSITPVLWIRNDEHANTRIPIADTENNRTGNDTPVYIGYTITVIAVTLSDDGAIYQCEILTRSEEAKLNVVGKYVNCDIHIVWLIP